MSYHPARKMNEDTEVLYRAVITYTSKAGTRTRYVGPYTTPAPARAFITKEKNWYQHMEAVVTGHVERCQPVWERLG